MEYHVQMIIRILVSCLCGIAIGFERKNRSKEAGVRTHCIVACSAAMMMVVSKYGFADLTEVEQQVGLDPSRMAAGIVTGVGFLGAGIIYIQRGSIKGLTTAAGLWATSGIGMAFGGGMYIIGFAVTIIILAAQFILHKSDIFTVSHKSRVIKLYAIQTENFQKMATEKLKTMDIAVNETAVTRHTNGNLDYTFYCEMPNGIMEESIIISFDCKCTVDVPK